MIKKAMFKKGIAVTVALMLGSALIACKDDKAGVATCNQVFSKAAVYVDSLPDEQKQAFNAQLESLKQQIEQNKTQAQELCQAALDQINNNSTK